MSTTPTGITAVFDPSKTNEGPSYQQNQPQPAQPAPAPATFQPQYRSDVQALVFGFYVEQVAEDLCATDATAAGLALRLADLKPTIVQMSPYGNANILASAKVPWLSFPNPNDPASPAVLNVGWLCYTSGYNITEAWGDQHARQQIQAAFAAGGGIQ